MITDLLSKLLNLGVDLNYRNEKLVIDSAPGVISTELLNEVKEHKDEIISFLKIKNQNLGFENIRIADKKPYYSLSSAQKRLFLIHQLDLNSTVYNVPVYIPLPNGLNKKKIQTVIEKLIDRHESLRTSFFLKDNNPVQKIHTAINFKVNEITIERDKEDTIKKDLVKPFNLEKAPLLRVTIINVKDYKRFLMIDLHHIVSDGVSQEILEKEFQQLVLGENLEPLKLQYKDYSEWQSEIIKKTEKSKDKEYWLNIFNDEIPVLDLPTDFIRPSVQNYDGFTVNYLLNEEETKSIKSFAKENNLTLYMTLLQAYIILLYKLSGQKDIVIGTPVAGRNHIDLEKIVGVFINTLAIRINLSENENISDFAKRVREDIVNAFDNQNFPFEDLVGELPVNRDLSRNPIFDVMFNLLNIHRQDEDVSEQINVNYIHSPAKSMFDLTLTAFDYGENILINFEYCSALFKSETIDRYINYFRRIINLFSKKSDIKISELDILSNSEKNQLIHDFNDTKVDYPTDKNIHQIFEKQTLETPDKIAIVDNDCSLTFAELNAKANILSFYLRKSGLLRNMIVALYGDRCSEMIISLLAVLKAGGCFLPIDISTGLNRSELILKESRATFLITQEKYSSKIKFDGNKINVESIIYQTKNVNNLPNVNTQNDLAYVIFTSGSTGKPKGVLVEHGNLTNAHFAWRDKYYLEKGNKNILQVASLGFDVFVGDIARSLLNGNKLVICKNDDRYDLSKLSNILDKQVINIFESTPGLIIPLLDYGYKNSKLFERLELIIIGSDSLNPQDYKSIQLKYGKNKRIINSYGVTEATIDTSFYEKRDNIPELGSIPIGKPLPNMEFYILKNYLLQPIGVPGELCIGGRGVARGYLFNDNLNNKKFIENPYIKGECLYRTGDLARWLPDGNVEFLGRIDNQVKIRGFRIELGEIENVIQKHKKIKECVVISRNEKGDKYLCAYLVKEREIEEEELREYLLPELPEYMIPSCFVTLDHIPLTRNGKIDHKSLPVPEIIRGKDYEAPSNDQELSLVEIWSEVLNIPESEISVTSDFFTLGGHSLKASILIGKIHKKMEVEFPFRDIFKYSSIRLLSNRINQIKRKGFESIPKAKDQDYYQLSSAQKRLYLLQQFNLDSTAYNMPLAISLSSEFEKEKIEAIIKELISRHESFRTRFSVIGDEPVQIIDSDIEFKLEEYTIDKSELSSLQVNFIRPFDLSHVPLLRAAIVDMHEAGCILLIDMHHIISDGISHEILEKEFRLLYSGATLETLTLQYKDFSEWQNSLKIQEKIQSQESYWLDKFKEEIPVLNLPTDYVRPITKSHEGYMISFALDEEETKNLRLFSNNHDLTLYMSLFSVFTILLSKLSGQDDIIIGTPVAGRNHTDLNNIVGMFVNTLAIRNKINGDDLLSDFIKILRENILNAYDNQDYQFEDLVDKVSVERDTSRNPLFDVTFNLLNHTEYEGDLTKLDDENPVHAPSTSKFDLTLTASDYGKQIMLSFGYSANLFSSDTIDRYIKYFKHLVKQLPEKEEEKISTIEIITELEKQQLLYQFNATEADYPKDKCIHQLFEEQVERTPDNIALVYGVETITYSELNKKSNRIAGYLNTKGKSTNTVIGLYFEPSFEMLISILGVLKSGALYLPINPEFPRDRVDYMLNDSGSDMLLKHSQTSISGLSGIEITEIADVINKTHKVELENKRHQPDSAYLIYTSGTTGNPKGVLLSHENLMNYFAWFNTVSNINRNDRTALVTSYAFDLGYTGLYSSLLIGGELHLVSKELYLSPKTFLDYIIKNRISYLKLTSSLYNLLIDDDKFANAVNNLRLLVLGGEEINVEAVKISISLNNKLQIINHYGPTEGTIGCISFKIHENNIIDYKSNPVIGRPVNNTRVYVLNQYDRIQPFGAVGELCISGDGLAKGYINAPELTAEKFMAHPFREGEKLYRTGDLARRLPDGNIEFLGRVDHQVKIRGFRIELGEIENTLLKHEYIKENVVVAREENGDKYLCAYVVFEQGQEQNINILRDYLTGLLPEYMVPTYFVELEALPLNANGKINLKVLPSPEVKAGDDYVAPSNEIEEKLVEIWSEVLNIPQEKISVTANFFAVGGDSLKVTLTLSKIHKRFKVKVRYADIFKNYVLLDQAKLISKLKKSEFLDIKHTEKREYYPLTRTQKGMFFHQKLYPSSINYTIPVFIPLPFNFKINELGENFEVLLNRHEALRTSIFEMKDAVYQKVHSKIKLQIPVYKRSRFDFHNVLNDIFRPFKLDEPPLIRLCVLIVENEQPILIINVHHIIFDGYSQNILSSELMKVTDGEKIPDLKYQFKDVAVWQSEDQFFLENHEKNKKYWLTKFRDGVPELNLPIDYERTMEENLEAEEFKIILQKDIANKIKQLAGKQDTTVFTVVLSLFYVWLYKITGDDDIIIGTPVSGRYHENLSKICGMFVNTIALRNNPKGDKCYLDFLKDIRKNVLDDLENQWFSFDELVSEICSERKIGRNPIFDVFYTFNGENGAYHEKQNFKSSLLDQKELIDVKFDLNLSGTIQGDEIILSVLFRKHLYEKGTMEYCIQILNNVIDVVMSNHDIKLNDISKNMNEYNYKTVEELDEDF